jgi:hypothetical protein
MFFLVFWTVYIPIVTIILAAAGEWLIHALRQLRAQAPCLFEPAASAVMQSMTAARWRRCTNHLPPVSGNLANRLCRKFSQSSSNFAQASVVDVVYVTFGSGGSEPLTIAGA